jgi:hypothetical protein
VDYSTLLGVGGGGVLALMGIYKKKIRSFPHYFNTLTPVGKEPRRMFSVCYRDVLSGGRASALLRNRG